MGFIVSYLVWLTVLHTRGQAAVVGLRALVGEGTDDKLTVTLTLLGGRGLSHEAGYHGHEPVQV